MQLLASTGLAVLGALLSNSPFAYVPLPLPCITLPTSVGRSIGWLLCELTLSKRVAAPAPAPDSVELGSGSDPILTLGPAPTLPTAVLTVPGGAAPTFPTAVLTVPRGGAVPTSCSSVVRGTTRGPSCYTHTTTVAPSASFPHLLPPLSPNLY